MRSDSRGDVHRITKIVRQRKSIAERQPQLQPALLRFNSNGQTIWIADAHRDGKRVHADEKLTAFVELESAIRAALRVADCLIPLWEHRFDTRRFKNFLAPSRASKYGYGH
jgi:hypothetical protein